MPIARSFLLMLAVVPGVAHAQAAPDPAPADDAVTIARMLRAGTDLSWLVSPSDAERLRFSPEQRKEADTIIGLARTARDRGLDTTPAAIAARRALDTVVLAEMARRDLEAGIRLSDADVVAAIRDRPGRYDEYRLSHIFVAVGPLSGGGRRTDAEALARAIEIRERLRRGADFAELAKTASDDPETAGEGGALPSMFGVYMADAFFRHVRALRVDAVTDPVRGEHGYHLIRMDQRMSADLGSARYLVEKDIRAERMPRLIAEAIRTAPPR